MFTLRMILGIIHFLVSFMFWLTLATPHSEMFSKFIFLDPLTYTVIAIFLGCILSFFYTLILNTRKNKSVVKIKNFIIDDFTDPGSDEFVQIAYRYFTFFNLQTYFCMKVFVFYPIVIISKCVYKLYIFFEPKFKKLID